MTRIKDKFETLKSENKKAFISYICAGDPNYDISLEILKKLPENGVDLIELGVPFLDPAGDGPIIEESAKRAIKNGMNLKKVLAMLTEFRKIDDKTPVILMGYYNNFLKYGLDKIFVDIEKSGGDGILIVDLPLEERDEIFLELKKTKLDFINLISPLSDDERIKKIVNQEKSSGFLYLISMLGITGTKEAKAEDNIKNLERVRKYSNLPIAIGFGIKKADQAKKFADIGFDGVVVGSTIVNEIFDNFSQNKEKSDIINNICEMIKDFSDNIKSS